MPKELVLDYGFHKISLRRYDEAINAFSVFVNLYPMMKNKRGADAAGIGLSAGRSIISGAGCL